MRDTYPWPRPRVHHPPPRQNYKSSSSLWVHHQSPQEPPQINQKTSLHTHVAELGMEEGVYTKEDPSFTV